MKKIKLSNGMYTRVDDNDYDYLSQFNWHYDRYAHRIKYFGKDKNKKSIVKNLRMHVELMSPPRGLETDHINGDKLDNRRKNLRVVTSRINKFNIPKRKNNTSGYTGVDWVKKDKKWRARLGAKELGKFKRKKDAISARKKAFDLIGLSKND